MLTSSTSRRRSRHIRWSNEPLEQRLMLAADCAAAVGQVAESQVTDSTATIVFVDAAVSDLSHLASESLSDAEVVLLDANQNGIEQITSVLSQRHNVRAVHVMSHGDEGRLQLGNQEVGEAELVRLQDQLRGWSASLTADADILLYGCDTGKGDIGARFITTLAKLTGADVAASTNTTGHNDFGGDWTLERHIGVIESGLAMSPASQLAFRNHLPITIRAAGSEGDENMNLLIDGVVVQSWTNVGGDARARQFNTFTHNANGISADRISIEFTNDLYDEANDFDRNLRVDHIVVDGTTYETEAPSVFSTGTWLPSDAVVPGFRQSEYLHNEGVFQYDQLATEITAVARGTTGDEIMSIQIDGVTQGTWNVSTQLQSYSVSVSGDVSPEQVRVVFSNDFYDPANGVDRNLVVDRISIGGTNYETEAPSVFSTSTWRPEDGVVPGFRQSETLHRNGYFQYAVNDPDPNPSDPGTIVIFAAGTTGEEAFDLQIDGTTVASFANVGGDFSSSVFNRFVYQHSSAVEASQVRLVFTNDLFDAATGTDRNMKFDNITIDGVVFETEAPTVFSTGTWLPADGTQPGFRQSESIHRNGYFQFDAELPEPGIIGLGLTQLTVDEDAGTASVPVIRTDGSDGAATAFFQTVGAEAIDGSDFVGTVNGRVDFADGQTTAFAVIDLIDDSQLEAIESFNLSLFRTEGAALGVPRTAIITIVDDEAGEDFVGHWRLDETAIGQTVVDASGSGNDGVHVNFNSPNGPSTDIPDFDSPNVRSLSFDGVNDYVSIAPDPSLDLSGGTFTQSVWINPQATDNAYHGVLGYQPGGGAANRYPGIWIYQQNRIHAGFGDGTNWNSFLTGEVLTPNQWNHVATTFDGTNYRAFVNGVEVFSTTDFAGRTPTGGNRVDIGRVDNYFVGEIDDVRIYNRALAPSEINVLLDGADVPPIPVDGEFVTNALTSGFDTPIAIDWLPDGRMLVAEQDGYVRVVNLDGSVQSTPLLDITSIVNSGTKDRGMLGFAIHPDFNNNPYIYVSYTYDPPEVNSNTGLGGPDGNGARVARISRFTVNSAGTFANPNSNLVLVGNESTYDNIGSPNIRPGIDDPHSCLDANGNPIEDCIPADETSHTIGDLEFGPDGMLYASSGDGGSFGRVDPINLRALDLDSLAGKILRIDPITGQGPSDNPFFDGDPNSNQSKVYAYGLRNPFRIAVNQDDGEVYIGDVGWTRWEEINTGRGANFGWPAFEGGDGVSSQTGGYQNLAEVQAYYATNPNVTAPLWARLHSDGARAIIMGDFVSDAYNNQYENALLFTDIGDQVLRAAIFDSLGNLIDVESVSAPVGFLVDIQTGPDGLLYYVDITGTVGRLAFQIG